MTSSTISRAARGQSAMNLAASRRAIAAMLVTLATAAPALAQAPAAAPPAADAGGIGDIVVTAQRREENIQDVGLAIQAITAEGLARSGIVDVSRLELITPGVTFARYGADSKISLRGANSNNTFLDSAPSVGVFVDGVYRPRAAQQTRAFFDVQRVEILKGPQGTLYGRNTLAGAVNLYSNGPDVDALSGGATILYQRFNTVRAEGFINVPLTPRLAVRLAGLFERGDGHVNNLAGEDLGNPDTISIRGSARYEGLNGGDVTLRITNVRERGNVTGLFALTGTCRNVTAEGLTDPFGRNLDCRNPRRGSAGSAPFDQLGRLELLKDFVHEDRIDEFNVTLEVNSPLGDTLAVKGIFSHTDFKLDLGQDSDFSEVRVSADFLRERVSSQTAEIQLSNTTKGRLQFTAGGYASRDQIDFLSGAIRFSRDDQSVRPLVAVPGFPGVNLRRLDPTPLLSTVIDLGDPNVVGRQGQSSNNFQYTTTETLGLFGQASYELFDGFRAVGGLRWSQDRKSAINYGGPASSTTLQGPQFPLAIPRTIDAFAMNRGLATGRSARTYSNVTWRGALEYDVNDDVLLFAQVATGFLSGSLTAANTTTDDQKSINYEAGIKSRFADDRVQVNASVYHTEYTNLVTSFQRPNNSGGVDTISSNGGDIKATGIEAIVEARPVPELRLTLAANYLDATFGTFNVLAPHQLVNGNPTAAGRFINLSGVRPQFAPEFTASFIGAYDIALGDGSRLTPQVQFFYSGRYSAQTQLSFIDPAGTQPAFTKTDLRLTWVSADDRFTIEGFVENLEDEVVNQRTTYGGDGIEQVTWGFPRNYGIRLGARF